MENQNPSAPPSCFLCGSNEASVIRQLRSTELEALWRAMGVRFKPEAWQPLWEIQVVSLFRCRRCGFEYCDPSLAGNEFFYHELDAPGYYSPSRPEFRRTLRFAARHRLRRVLDVGCGNGMFLDSAKEAGLETYGIELNTTAAAQARSRGHTIFTSLLEDLPADAVAQSFDLVCFFQVLEHVPDPVGMMQRAKMLVRVGGAISVAVPLSRGLLSLAPWDPHQWPPHHISRWRRADLGCLAQAAGLELVAAGGDVMVGQELQRVWNSHQRLAPAIGRRSYPGGAWLPSLVTLVYRKTGLKHVLPRWGHSIFGFFRKA